MLIFTFSDGIGTGYALDGPGSNPSRDVSFLHSVQTGTGAQPVSYPMCTRGIKRSEREYDRALPSSAEVKNGGAIPPLPDISSWHSA
jgi:hypothetical protein